jgi:hypothetical protein
MYINLYQSTYVIYEVCNSRVFYDIKHFMINYVSGSPAPIYHLSVADTTCDQTRQQNHVEKTLNFVFLCHFKVLG